MTFAYAQPCTFVCGMRPLEWSQGWNGLTPFPWQSAGIAAGTPASTHGPEWSGRRCLLLLFLGITPAGAGWDPAQDHQQRAVLLCLPWNKSSPASWSRLGYSGKLQNLTPIPTPLLLCGAAGSAQGWAESVCLEAFPLKKTTEEGRVDWKNQNSLTMTCRYPG